ncbi:PEP-CTERM sorting domain-containing protein [Paucibacter sp. APW11]|uniref:PEP-CTERM sorting domain-containing protein n=1 Tax=Roseateles aquae TaxID=3077235 RepID=A0ABU3PHA7_9BURK|nr:PEP-CTERM sorting domain-containing protein [Paucibacter sp. APW11]MDT9001959.1 PEP-CTERM sorting domain-containing protein [Paucibacter sp. APW11]
MIKKTQIALSVALLAAGAAHAGSFNNGGFESGDLTGWTTGAGYWNTANMADLTPANYLPGGAYYNAAYGVHDITNVGGVDAITGLSTVRYGNHAVRTNNAVNNYSVSLIQQKVTNYSGTSINFSWAAVLQASHGATDSDNFTITLTDNTTNSVLTTISYNSATNGAIFSQTGSWFYTKWIDETINVTAGHDYTLSLLAADCPYGGHAGYVYLDGFGTVSGGPGDTTLPEPASLALVGLALAGVGLSRRRKAKAA